jgi:DNA-binding IclR family transcriptional regulator
LPDEELEVLLEEVVPRLAAYPDFSIQSIRRDIEAARLRGYTIMLNRVVERMGAVGVPIIGMDGRPFAALSIAALSDRLSAREEKLVAALQREARQIADPRVPAPAAPDTH